MWTSIAGGLSIATSIHLRLLLLLRRKSWAQRVLAEKPSELRLGGSMAQNENCDCLFHT
jgi:hypothetical protein